MLLKVMSTKSKKKKRKKLRKKNKNKMSYRFIGYFSINSSHKVKDTD